MIVLEPMKPTPFQSPADPNTSLPAIEPMHYRRVLGNFATGVTVITASYQGEPVGMAVNSFCSVSLEPAIVSFCAATSSSTWPHIEAAGNFCVNILAEDQQEVCQQFARKGIDRFQSLLHQPAVSGTPVLSGVLAWIDCRIASVVPVGDHVIVLGYVRDLSVATEGKPLVFYKGKYGTFAD